MPSASYIQLVIQISSFAKINWLIKFRLWARGGCRWAGWLSETAFPYPYGRRWFMARCKQPDASVFMGHTNSVPYPVVERVPMPLPIDADD